jgi:hypothetical protein
MSRIIDQSEVFEIVGAPSWQARDGSGEIHDIDLRLLKDGMPFDDAAHATMIGTVRHGPDRKTFIPTKVSMISKPRQR